MAKIFICVEIALIGRLNQNFLNLKHVKFQISSIDTKPTAISNNDRIIF